MIDVKKLITGFLILATAGGVSALVVENNGGLIASGGTAVVTENAGAGAATGGAASQGSDTLSGNAFLPTQDVATFTTTNPDTSSTDAILNDPTNLTGVLANSYLKQLALTNPSGPQDDGTGNMALTPPDTNSVILDFASSSQPTSIVVPDWDFEAAKVPVIVTGSSPTAIVNYSNAVGDILKKSITQTNLQSGINGIDPSSTDIAVSQLSAAIKDISGLQVPSSVVNFQKSLIKTFVYTKNSIALLKDASKDPIKTAVIFQVESDKFNAALEDLQTQVQKAQQIFSDAQLNSNVSLSHNGNNLLASIQSLFGVPVAHAQWATIDAIAESGIWAQLGKMIAAEIKDTLLQIAKNTIVFAMQRVIFSKIAGANGVPGFIQNWALDAANALQAKALSTLDRQMQCIGVAPFAPQIRLTLKLPYENGGNNVCAVQFNAQLANNLNNFYNNFESGGWIMYGQTLQPDNNYFGSLFFTAQAVDNAAQQGYTAAQTKSVANQGFKGVATCDDGSDPNGFSYSCLDYGANVPDQSKPFTCPGGQAAVQVSNYGYCHDGSEPSVQSPGTIANAMVSNALDSNFKLITNANNIAGLVVGVFTSIVQQALNSLANQALSSVNGLLSSANAGGGGGGGGGAAPQAIPIACNVSPQAVGVVQNGNSVSVNVSPNSFNFSATGGDTIDAQGNDIPPQFVWSVPGGTPNFGNGPSLAVTFNATGTYTATVVNQINNVSADCAPVTVNSLQ